MEFALVIIAPNDAFYARAFDEVVTAIHFALIELGHQSTITHNSIKKNAINILIGANLNAAELLQTNLPNNTIIFNFEQLFIGSPWLSPSYIDLLKRYRIWDYSLSNMSTYAKLSINHVTHVPLGYVNQLSSITGKEQDIDVLFYGAVNNRRHKILIELEQQGINIVNLYGVFGTERDDYIARSKIVLNMHYFDAKVFEIVRIFYLLSNKQFVISESSTNTEDEFPFREAMAISPYEQLTATCMHYLKLDNEREKIAQRGFDLMCNRLQHHFLAPIIAQL